MNRRRREMADLAKITDHPFYVTYFCIWKSKTLFNWHMRRKKKEMPSMSRTSALYFNYTIIITRLPMPIMISHEALLPLHATRISSGNCVRTWARLARLYKRLT